MDNFGHDVAQKIKLAIKAKLVELDSYIDDELPDYIMVMVANKKSKAQMMEDLSLFLGDNTVKFVTWLHDVLGRLQAVTLDSQRKSESKLTTSTDYSKQNPSDVVSTSEKDINDDQDKTSRPMRENSPISISQGQNSTIANTLASAEQELQDEMLTIKADTYADDMLDNELQEELAATIEISSGKSSAEINPISPRKILSALSTPLSEPLKRKVANSISNSKRVSQESESRPIGSGKTKDTNHSSSRLTATSQTGSANKTKVSPHDLDPQSGYELPSRKRKAPCSTVGAVVNREFPQEEEDDEYDPRRPTIGNVASIVQVTRRKSSVPPERQANKMLLLKAVDEAQKSILQSAQRNPINNSGKPSSNNLFTRAFLERQKQWQQHQQEWRIKPITGMKETFSITTLKSSLARAPPLFKDQVHAKVEDDEEEEEEEEEEGEQEGEQQIKEEFEEVKEEVEYMPEEETEEVEGEVQSLGSDVIEVEEEIDNLEDEGFADYKIEEPASTKNHNRHVVVQNKMVERPQSPKFIITLDGVDDNAFMTRISQAHWMESNDHCVAGSDLNVGSESDDLTQEEMVVNDSVNLEDLVIHHYDDDEDDLENENKEYELAVKRQKVEKTCRFWPSCKNGAKCPFNHPNVHCKSFPNCKYGNKCLYIHPNCKYNSTCTRRNCPFTHTSQKMPAVMPVLVPISRPVSHPVRRPSAHVTTPVVPQKIVCRNIPTCNNVDCQYYHPKPCRYGQGCTRPDCVFSHPPLPTPDKLKWNKKFGSLHELNVQKELNTRTNISERKFAANQVQRKLAVPLKTLKM